MSVQQQEQVLVLAPVQSPVLVRSSVRRLDQELVLELVLDQVPVQLQGHLPPPSSPLPFSPLPFFASSFFASSFFASSLASAGAGAGGGVVGPNSLGSGVGPGTRKHLPALRSHTSLAIVHLHLSFLPQPSSTGSPHRPSHVSGVHMHLLLVQFQFFVCGHPPQITSPPQPSGCVPHFASLSHDVLGTQLHV
jgi:hypothetical protein